MSKNLFILFGFFFCSLSNSQNINTLLGKAFNSKDSSNYYFKAAKKIIKNDADDAEFYFCKGAFCTDNNKLDSAIYYGKIAQTKMLKINKINSVYYVNNNLAKVYRKQGNYKDQISILHESLQLAEKNKSKTWIYYSLVSLANAYHDFEQFENGIKYGKLALQAANKLEKDKIKSISGALSMIAINYDDWNKPQEALKYHYKIIDITPKKDTIFLQSTFNNIGNTLLKSKKYKEAKTWVKRALKLSLGNYDKDTDDINAYNLATNYTNLATIAFKTDDYAEAEKMFALAEKYVKKSKNKEKERDFYYQRAEFNKKRNNLTQTIKDQESYLQLRDSIYAKDLATKTAELEIKFQTEKKEKELLQVKSENLIKENKLKQRNYLLLIAFLTILGISIIGWLFTRQQKLKNKQQSQEFQLKTAIASIENQNKLNEQRLSISRDLHDNIGAQLTFIISSVDNLKFGFPNMETKVATHLSKISTFTKDTIVELRDTIWAMNTSEFTFDDLSSRIFNFIEKAKIAKEDLKFDFNINENVKTEQLSSLQGINIYRTIQEAVNNAIKYASSTKIEIDVYKNENKIILEISDNGNGFDIENTTLGNGITNMKKRIEEIGGSFEITSNKNGTKINVEL